MSGLIFGIDVVFGSVRSGTVHPQYALARVLDGKVVAEEKNVTGFWLIRYLVAERPEILAVDSIQEIARLLSCTRFLPKYRLRPDWCR